jgi:hypothetical protein
MAADPLAQLVYTAAGYKPFGQLSVAEVEARAGELTAATGWGPTARVGSVARAWSELASRMRGAGAATVADLGRGADTELATRLWVLPPL